MQTTDLNTSDHLGFNGVWTTRSDVKRWNRDAEATTESAEAIAYFASRSRLPLSRCRDSTQLGTDLLEPPSRYDFGDGVSQFVLSHGADI